MVLLIALLHAVPVVLASLTGSRTITILVAVLSGIAGFLTGNPTYIAFDIGAVLLATFVTMPESSGSPGRWRAFFTGMFGDLVQVVVAVVVAVVLIGGGVIYYNRVHGPCADDKLRVKNQTFQQCRAVEDAKTKRF
jgi:hypothetical protein